MWPYSMPKYHLYSIIVTVFAGYFVIFDSAMFLILPRGVHDQIGQVWRTCFKSHVCELQGQG